MQEEKQFLENHIESIVTQLDPDIQEDAMQIIKDSMPATPRMASIWLEENFDAIKSTAIKKASRSEINELKKRSREMNQYMQSTEYKRLSIDEQKEHKETLDETNRAHRLAYKDMRGKRVRATIDEHKRITEKNKRDRPKVVIQKPPSFQDTYQKTIEANSEGRTNYQ